MKYLPTPHYIHTLSDEWRRQQACTGDEKPSFKDIIPLDKKGKTSILHHIPFKNLCKDNAF